MPGLRVLVCGGCYYSDRDFVFKRLDSLDIALIIHGACPYGGADIIAEDWAKARQVPYVGHPANFKLLGRKAGPIRNGEMLDKYKPSLVIAFPGDRGTEGMVKQARARGVEVHRYD